MESFGKRLKRFRTQRGFTIKGLAEAVGIPPTTYREWEYGRQIKGNPYERLASVLSVSISELITGYKGNADRALNMIETLEKVTQDLKKEVQSF